MSYGPVYCPTDRAELQWVWDEDEQYYFCPECSLMWNGQFPVSNNFKPNRGVTEG